VLVQILFLVLWEVLQAILAILAAVAELATVQVQEVALQVEAVQAFHLEG
jgi:hypothetical protein